MIIAHQTPETGKLFCRIEHNYSKLKYSKCFFTKFEIIPIAGKVQLKESNKKAALFRFAHSGSPP